MDKKCLQTYATWSKQYLEQQIELSLKSLGIHSDDDIRDAKRVGDVTIIDGDPTSYPAELKSQRDSIIRLINAAGYKNTIETFAYTWFNRIIALRFMEIHGFLPHGFRVLSDRSGGIEPEILKNLSYVKSELSLDMSVCSSLKEKNEIDSLFRYVLFKQCSALSDILPMLFDSEDSFLELLLPKSLLKGDTVITRLLDIPEESFLDEIEVIGWLYQYYVSAKKDKVFADLKKNIRVTTENIPAATQLFTPDWIVKYMVENSLGRIWLESYPESSIKADMHYYLDDIKQDDYVEAALQNIRYKNINPEELRILEPCCGSGHMLVYLFDLLYKMYEEKGYMPRDIPTLILSKNLFGLEVDKRASQLASFALVMRARSINNRFFEKDYYVKPLVYEIYDSKLLLDIGYGQQLNETSLNNDEKREIANIVELYINAKSVGSLVDVSTINVELIQNAIAKLKNEVLTTFNYQLLNDGVKLLSKLLEQTKVMSSHYDVVCTNPPYMTSKSMCPELIQYVQAHYEKSKSDLYSCFIQKCLDYTRINGYCSMITIQGWMYLSSFADTRQLVLKQLIVSLIRIGYNSFPELNSQVAHACSFVLRRASVNDHKGQYFELNTGKVTDDKNKVFLDRIDNKDYYIRMNADFLKIPETPIAFTFSDTLIASFNNKTMLDIAEPKQGLATADNNRFLRLWYEVSINKCFFNANNAQEAKESLKKWFPYNKGGEFRKWYGNNDYIINWENDGAELRRFKNAVLRNQSFYFRECFSWSKIATDTLAFRYKPCGHLFDVAGTSVFATNDKLFYLLGLCNSVVAMKILKTLSPTVNFEVGHISSLPVIISKEHKSGVDSLVKNCISIAKNNWDSFETSWDFKAHPLIPQMHENDEALHSQFAEDRIKKISLLSWHFERWASECDYNFCQLKDNEEELNRIFIDIYGLQSELTPTVCESDVTIRKADYQRDIKSLISYLVGVVMGRYSLDVPGIAYAGGEWDESKYVSNQPDDDGIVPIYVGVGMEDGLTARIADLIKLIYGEESFKDNIDFIAEALGKSNNESSMETINRYLNDGFYADHIKIYQKRPIYWLFSSGKNKGFKCLIYIHRYNKDTLARINAKYYLPESTRQKIELGDIEERIKAAEGKEKIRIEKTRAKLVDRYNETIEYGQVLDHMANKYIDIELDDGVNVNYAKFQGVELVSDSGVKIKKDLLVPLK